MSDFSALLQSLSESSREPSWLRASRASALAQYEQAAAPVRTDEEWRRTDVSKFLVSDLSLAGTQTSVTVSPEVWIPASQPRGGALFSGALADGVVFTSLGEAAKTHPDLVQKCLALQPRRAGSKLDHLADALWGGSVFLYVPPKVTLDLPLSAFAAASGRDWFQKVLIVVDQQASANFWIDQFSADTRWVGSVCDVFVKEGGRLSFLNVQRHSVQTTLLSTFNAVLERGASLDLMTVEAGSALAKEQWNLVLSGEGAAAKAFGLVRASGKQHFDETLFVSHLKPRTQSEVLFKTVAADEARSIFSGLIHVSKEAQKTTAYQTNRNLLLSKQARADTIPKLEILADDVKCGHGAAVSSIDEDQIFYLMSRGMSRDLAKAVIVEGFYADVLGRFMREDSIKGDARDRIHDEVSQSIREILVGSSALYEASVS